MTVEEILALVGEYVTQRDHDIARMEAFGDDGFEASQAARQALTAALGPVMAVVEAAVAQYQHHLTYKSGASYEEANAAMNAAIAANDALDAAVRAYLSSRAPAVAPGSQEDQP